MTSAAPSEPRSLLHKALPGVLTSDPDQRCDRLAALLHEDSVWECFAPLNRVTGLAEIASQLFEPLMTALPNALRRDEIFIGGDTVMGEGHWVATLGHYVGTMVAPFCGIQPSGKLVFLRFGEYFRVEQGRIIEARILYDLIDLMRQVGKLPHVGELGTEMLFPGPATHDGVLPNAPERSAATGALVWKMLADLHVYDPVTFRSVGQTGPNGAWHDDMLWYGPGAIGSNYRYEGFEQDHRVAFLKAFPDRKGGNHFCRISDGDYVASGGWPSQTLTHRDTYLGVPATNKAMTLRVMDLWRCEGGKIMENWVLLDFIDLLSQMGRDLIAEHQAM